MKDSFEIREAWYSCHASMWQEYSVKQLEPNNKKMI